MRTFTDLEELARDFTGLTSNTSAADAREMRIIDNDINNGIKMFRHGARVAYTQRTATSQCVSGQVDYLLPPDCLRVTTVRGVLPNGVAWNIPLQEVVSEEKWLELTMVPYSTFTNPLFYYIRGSETLEVYPAPADTGSSLIVNYEPKMPNLSIQDITSTSNSFTGSAADTASTKPTPVTASVTNESKAVVLSEAVLNVPANMLYFEITDGYDGNTYKIDSILDDHKTFNLQQYYQLPGLTETTAQFRIGQSMDFPEEFQVAPAYYAAAQYFYKRKDNGQAGLYDGMFQQLIATYKENYGKKTTRRTQVPANLGGYSPFFLTPGSIPGN